MQETPPVDQPHTMDITEKPEILFPYKQIPHLAWKTLF